MKSSLGAIAAFVALAAAGSANAADMALKAPPPAPVPVWTWTGFYVGGNIGYGWGKSDPAVSFFNEPQGILLDSENGSFNVDGVIGGGQAGYNWQKDNWVLGIEADIQASGQSGSGTLVCATACKFSGLPVSETLSEKLDWFGTVRGRLGVTVTPTILLYATGGLAYGEIATNGSISDPVTFSFNTTKTGWTAGAGLEGRISGNWTAKIEYLYMDLGSISDGLVGTPIVTSGIGFCDPHLCTLSTSFTTRFTDNILRLGVNYKFP
jgi:outer membrane immunogenic protein